MDIFTALQSAIYYISTYLLYPVIVALLLCVALILIDTGSFLYELYSRTTGRWEREFMGETISGRFIHLFTTRLNELDQGDRHLDVRLERLLNEMEYLISRRLERSRLISRIGPMLGLMGTLIPMGPALIGLSHGDIETLADNLIIAFGTTVVGLLVGGVSYAIAMVRTRWYDREMDEMEFVCEMIGGDRDEVHEKGKE